MSPDFTDDYFIPTPSSSRALVETSLMKLLANLA